MSALKVLAGFSSCLARQFRGHGLDTSAATASLQNNNFKMLETKS